MLMWGIPWYYCNFINRTLISTQSFCDAQAYPLTAPLIFRKRSAKVGWPELIFSLQILHLNSISRLFSCKNKLSFSAIIWPFAASNERSEDIGDGDCNLLSTILVWKWIMLRERGNSRISCTYPILSGISWRRNWRWCWRNLRWWLPEMVYPREGC